MKTLKKSLQTLGACVALGLYAVSAQAAMSEDDVKSLMKKNNCMKCHNETKEKDGPSYKKIAANFKGKADAAATVHKRITTLNKVEIDGKKEDHEPLKTKDEAEINAIVQWILSR